MPAENPQQLFAQGNARYQEGDLAAAERCYRLALELDPYFAQASFNLGCALERGAGPAAALPHFERAARLAPEWAQAKGSLGLALARLGRMEEAAAAFRAACALAPGDPGNFNDLGLALTALSRGERAREAFAEAVRLDPGYPEPHNNLAILFERFGNAAAAAASAREALRLRPGYPEAHLNLANALKGQGRHLEALDQYRAAAALRPGFTDAQSGLLFALLYPDLPEEEVFAEHAAFGSRLPPPRSRHDNVPDPDRPLNVGYVSADFREHAVARFIEPVLASHDRDRFRVHCYSNAATHDARSERLARLAWRFTQIAHLSDRQVEELVRRDRIDILIDLSGHSAGNRLPLFALKPAPVQATWLGYPASTGLRAIDYRITDAACDPPGETERFHAEELLRLPGHFSVFLPPEEAPEPGPPPCLANGFVTFGSFNNPAKITPETVALWSAALLEVPGSRLILKGYSLSCPESRARLASLFAARGVDPARLEFSGNTPGYAEHLLLYRRVDLALDTYPYNGTTTTCEALWMGVPVVTLRGKTHRSRVGSALLAGAGLADLAAAGQAEFPLVAARLAGDPVRLAALRKTLRGTMAASPLTDGAGFTAGLERALVEAWGSWCRDRRAAATREADPLERELAALLVPLRAGDKSALAGIQGVLGRQFALDRARALDREEGATAPGGAGIGSETLEELAELLFAASLVTPAELLCRYLEDRGTRSPRVSRLLGEAALSLGQPGVAARELARAVESGDGSRATRIRLVKAQEQARLVTPTPERERYLLVKAWGYGFWSDVNHLLGQFLLAELTGRTPVVQWGGNSLFGDDPKSNAFLNFYLPVNDLTVWDLVTRAKSFYPPKWTRANLALDELNKFDGPWSCASSLFALERGEDVVVSDFHYSLNDLRHWIPPGHPLEGLTTDGLARLMHERYLKVRPELALKARHFHSAHLSGGKVLALHVRGGDKGGEDPGLHRLNALYHPEIARFLDQHPDGRLFLLTDDRRILAEYLERYPRRVAHTVSTRTGSDQGVHYAKHRGGRRALGEEVLVDALIAARCDRFLGNGLSNVSVAVAQLKEWAPGTCRLFGARLDLLRQVTLYGS